MLLITEQSFDSKPLIVEGNAGEKEYYIEGVFMQAGIKNRNGRVYPREVIERQIAEYNEKFVKRKRALGELGHPDTPTVLPERVSHNIIKLEFANDTDVVGKAKLMDTPYGNIAKAFVREGIELGVSSRGLGSVRESAGSRVVQNDFLLTAIDIVADPSAPGAFVNGIMENKEWVFVDGVLVERDIADLRESIDADTRKSGSKFAESNIFNHIDRILANAQRLKDSRNQ